MATSIEFNSTTKNLIQEGIKKGFELYIADFGKTVKAERVDANDKNFVRFTFFVNKESLKVHLIYVEDNQYSIQINKQSEISKYLPENFPETVILPFYIKEKGKIK